MERIEKLAKQAVRDFVSGAAAGDQEKIFQTFSALDFGHYDGGGWARAMRAVSRLPSVPDATRDFFLQVYLDYGDHIRQECSDLALVGGLRVLLPRYEGPAMCLYRGEGFMNRKRRTYGASWTANIHVARGFAERSYCRHSDGGSVLLETFASPDAILCAPYLIDDRYAEQEFIVDRRYLSKVSVVERFSAFIAPAVLIPSSGAR